MSDAPRQLPPKKEVALTLLKESSLFVHLDPRRAGVSVPKWFTGQSQLVLQVGLNMAIPIPDLKLDDEGISCTLSFNRSPFWCRLPWEAIYAIVGDDGRGMVWPDDVPPEVAQQMQRQPASPPAAAKQQPNKRARGKLAAVEAGDEEGAPRKKNEPKPSGTGLRAAEAGIKEPRRIESAAKRSAAAAPNDDDASKPAAASPPSSPAPESPHPKPAPAGGKKPKRELPPYLRVIK